MESDIEHEGKLLEIDIDEMKERLQKIGAVLVGEFFQRRYVFNTIPVTESRWLRLRTNGSKNTMAVKEISDDSIEGTEEWEVDVSDFEQTLKILQKIGLNPKSYQENRRTEYTLDGCSVSIDEWPKIPPYLEIEGDTKEDVVRCASKLNISVGDITGINTMKVYEKYGIDLGEISELKFSEA